MEVRQGVDVALGVETEQVDLAKTGKSLKTIIFKCKTGHCKSPNNAYFLCNVVIQFNLLT